MNRIRRIIITFLIVIAIAGIIHFTSDKKSENRLRLEQLKSLR